MSATAARIAETSHRFDTVLVSVDYSSHPVSGAGRWAVRATRRGYRPVSLIRPYSHRDGGDLKAARAVVAALFPDAVVTHSPDPVTGYRFEVYRADLAHFCATHGHFEGDHCPGAHFGHAAHDGVTGCAQ